MIADDKKPEDAPTETTEEKILKELLLLNTKFDEFKNYIEKSMDKPSDKSDNDEGDDTQDQKKLEESEKAMKQIASVVSKALHNIKM